MDFVIMSNCTNDKILVQILCGNLGLVSTLYNVPLSENK